MEERYGVDGGIDWNLNGSVAPISKASVEKPTGDVKNGASSAPVANGGMVSKSDEKVTNGTKSNTPTTATINPKATDDLDDDEDAIDALNEIASSMSNDTPVKPEITNTTPESEEKSQQTNDHDSKSPTPVGEGSKHDA